MAGRRQSARLRKRPRVSYAQPADDEAELSGAEQPHQPDREQPKAPIEKAAGASSDDESILSTDSDEDFSLSSRKKKKKAKTQKRKKNRWTPEKPKRADKRKFFRWAELPGELRNIIYSLCLTSKTEIILRPSKLQNRNSVRPYISETHKPLGLSPNLLLVNKATYAEGGPILYGQHFVFDQSISMFIFLSSLSAVPKAWVQEITLSQRKWEGYKGSKKSAFILPAFTALIGTTNLKHLHIGINYNPYGFEKQIYGYAYWWLEGTARMKGSMEAAVDLIDVRKIPSSRPRERIRGFWPAFYQDDSEGSSGSSQAGESTSSTRRLREELLERLK